MSFSSEVRAELYRTVLSRRCCAQAEAYGALLYCNQFIASQVCISTESNAFATRLPVLFHRVSQFSSDRTPEEGVAKRVFSITEPDRLSTLWSALGHEPVSTLTHHINSAVLEEEHCRLAFFRGAFLAGGSITDPVKRYHPELSTPHLSVSRELRALLLKCGFTPKETTRKANSITYFKQSEAIEDFLTAIGMPLTTMEIMNAKVGRDLRGNINRRVNCDAANPDRAVDATQGQIEAIYRLKERGMLEELPDKLKEAVDLRVAHPELTLAQLAELYELPASKPVFNRRLRKLVETARVQGGEEKKGQIAMEKQVVQKCWKLISWGFTATAVAPLTPGLVLTLELALFLGLGVLTAVVSCTGLCTAVIKLRCPACGGPVYHQAMRAQEGIPFACPKCGRKSEMK